MIGMQFSHAVWKYNLTYVFDSDFDSKGLFYPRALLHLTVGLYLAEICLIGLFGLNLAYGQMALMVIFFVFTGIVHMSLRDAVAPLIQNLPQTMASEEGIQEEEKLAAMQAENEANDTGQKALRPVTIMLTRLLGMSGKTLTRATRRRRKGTIFMDQ